MFKPILLIMLVAVISSAGTSLAAFSPLQVFDESSVFAIEATNLKLTCPDGTVYENVMLDTGDYSRALFDDHANPGDFWLYENKTGTFRFILNDGYTDGTTIIASGHLLNPWMPPCNTDIHPSSFSIISQCNYHGTSNEDLLLFIHYDNIGYSIEFVPTISEIKSSCTIPMSLFKLPAPVCHPSQVVDEKTNTCVTPPELLVRGYDAKDSSFFNFDNKYSAPGTMGQNLNGVRADERIMVVIDNHIDDPLIEFVSLALNGRPYEYRPVDSIPGYNDELVLPLGTYTIITSENTGTNNPRPILVPDQRQAILIDLAENFDDRRVVELHVRTSTGTEDFTRQIQIGSFVATPDDFS